MIRALVLRYADFGAQQILHCYLNKRGHEPEACDLLRIHIEYPEPGVIRKYCGTDVLAWIDTVIAPKEFRQAR